MTAEKLSYYLLRTITNVVLYTIAIIGTNLFRQNILYISMLSNTTEDSGYYLVSSRVLTGNILLLSILLLYR